MPSDNTRPRIEVYASGSWVGFHCWPAATEPVAFLASRHRHKFCWKAWWVVQHDDRDIEFCQKQQEIDAYVRSMAEQPAVATWSCERWALVLLETFQAIRVEVSEDGENGSVVTRT